MAKRKSTKSLHIQNDQTDVAGVYQRNRGADLFMEAPGGIQQFTNFDARVTSYNNSSADVTSGVFNSPFMWKDTERKWGQAGQGTILKNKKSPTSLPFEFDKGQFYPSDIKIVDDIAVVAYREHNQKVYLTNEIFSKGHIIIAVTYDKAGEAEVFNDVNLNSGLVFPNLGTAARNLTEFTGGKNIPGSNAGVSSGYSITLAGEVAEDLGIACTTTTTTYDCSIESGDVWSADGFGGWVQSSTVGCGDCFGNSGSSGGGTTCDCDSIPPSRPSSTEHADVATGTCANKITTVCDPFVSDDKGDDLDKKVNEEVDENCAGQPMPADAAENKEEGVFFTQVKNKKGEIIDVLQGLVVDFTAKSTPDNATLLSLRSRSDSNLIWVDECAEDTVTYYYRVPVIVSEGFYWSVGVSVQCGRVDIFERRSGTITAVDGNKITVTGPTVDDYEGSDGLAFDPCLLNGYDRIKIVGGLLENPYTSGGGDIHPINGIKYVKRTGSDTEYYIYDDANLTQETDTSSLRGTDGVRWALYPDNAQTAPDTAVTTSAWRYKTTKFSPHGLNGTGGLNRYSLVTDKAMGLTGGYSGGYDKVSRRAGQYPSQGLGKSADLRNGLDLVAWGYKFGQAIDIIKQPGTDYYWLAISELGNTCGADHGMSYQGVLKSIQNGLALSSTVTIVDAEGDAVLDDNGLPQYETRGISLQAALDFGIDPRKSDLANMFINHVTDSYDDQINWSHVEWYSYGGVATDGSRFDVSTTGGRVTTLISPYGYQAKRPEVVGYGKVWLYKVSMNSADSAIQTIGTPEEINAGTRNGLVATPPATTDEFRFYGGWGWPSGFGAISTPEYLYWWRAWISNLKSGTVDSWSGGPRGFAVATGGSSWNFNSGYPVSWMPSWPDPDGETDEYDNPGGHDTGMDIDMPDGGMMGGDMGNMPNSDGGGGIGLGGGGDGDDKGNVIMRGGSTNLFCIEKEDFHPWLHEYEYEPPKFGNNDQWATGKIDIFRHLIFAWYQTNESPYAPVATTVGAITNGWNFADGFGFNICMKTDDVTGGDKPIIAIANTVFPYLPPLSMQNTKNLDEIQKKLDKLKRKGYEDPNTQAFVDRHTKTNEFIKDFLSENDGENIDIGSFSRNGSIFIHNCNQQVNTQELDWTMRTSRDDFLVPSDNRKPWHSSASYKSAYEYCYWYGAPPSMMFDNGSLLVGTDEGRIKVFKEGPVVTQRINDDFVTNTTNMIFSRIGTKDDEDYVIDDYNMGGDLGGTVDSGGDSGSPGVGGGGGDMGGGDMGDMGDMGGPGGDDGGGGSPPVTNGGWKRFTEEDKKHMLKSGTDFDNWLYKFAGTTTDNDKGYREVVHGYKWVVPIAIEDNKKAGHKVGNRQWVDSYSYRNYSSYYINAPEDVLTTPIQPTLSQYSDKYHQLENQLDPRVKSGDQRNILLSQPFGYRFRCSNELLVAHGASYTNEFDITGSTIAQRLYLHEVNKNGFFDLFQKITPATSNLANGTIPADGIQNPVRSRAIATFTNSGRKVSSSSTKTPAMSTPEYVNVFPEGSMTFEETLEESRTIAYLMTNMYDVLSGVLVLMTPYGKAIFNDSGISKSYDFTSDHRSSQVSPYFSFTEEFNAKHPYNLNDMYSYREGLGIDYSVNIYDINDEHSGLCAFYNIETNSSQDNSIRILKSVKFTVDVEENTTLKGEDDADVAQVLPVLTFYKDDPRKTIRQTGVTSDTPGDGSKLLYGSNSSNSYDSPSQPLYADGLQDSAALVKYPTYNRTSVAGDQGWRGTVTIDGPDIAALTTHLSLIKNSSDNKTILYNDGNGYSGSYANRNSYSQTFDDVNKASFDSRARIESTVVVGLMSHNTQSSDFGGIYRTKWLAGRKGTGTWGQDLNYIPYSRPFDVSSNAHSFINKAKISSVQFAYRDYDLGDIRRFRCATFREDQHSPKIYSLNKYERLAKLGYLQPATEGILRMGQSKTSAFFDKDNTVLDGADSKSIQIIDCVSYDYWMEGEVRSGEYDRYTYINYFDYSMDPASRALDIQKPEFLSLSIFSAPNKSENFALSTDGHFVSSGLAPTYIGGVATHAEGMPLKIGSTPVVNYLGLSLPVPFGFKCDGVSLFTPTAFGTSIVSGMSAQFPGGTGVNKGVSLAMGMPHNSGGMRLAMGQPHLGSGNMNIAMSGVYGSYNSIPCIEGNLYLNATYVDNGNMPLNLGRLSDSGNMPLYMRTPDLASGVVNLAINTEPFNSNSTSYPSGLHLRQKGWAGDTASANLYIGEQASAGSAPLFLMQPHRIPFIDPQSPATYEGDDTSQIPTLYVSGAAVPTANSLDDNFQHQKQMVRENSQLDYSSNAETIISYNNSNSLSRNAFIPNGTHDYGVKRISRVGSSLENYNGLGTASFYDNEMSRQAIDSNGTYLAVGTNSSAPSSMPPLQIFNILDENSVELEHTYTQFAEDLLDLGFAEAGQIMFYYKDVKVSSENKIAVSIRAEFNEYFSDMIFILEVKEFNRVIRTKNSIDECAISQPRRFNLSVETSKRWRITSAFTSKSWKKTINKYEILNKVMGESISWRGEDLYYGKQSTRFANVYARYESDDYATENKAFGFGNTSDATNYNNNINNVPAGTKTGFGAKIQLAGDFAFVSAPLLDPYIANNTLSAVNAASPDGAVYIFKYDSGWSYVDAIYSGGLISSAVAGVDSCAYDAKLFGYDLDYDSKSGYLSVSEPMSNTVYQFNINDTGTPSLLNSYSSSDSKFGTFVNSVSAGLITNTKSKIQDVVYSQDFEFSTEEIESEIQQYVPGGNVINSVSHEIVSVQKATLTGKETLLVTRDFEVNYGAGKVKRIQKISLLSLHDINGTLYISGPSPVSEPINLSVLSPSGGSTGDLGITFGSIGTNDGISLHLTNYIGSGEAPLYMRGPLQRPHTLYMSADRTPVASGASLVTAGPIYASNASDLSIEGKAVRDLSSSMFVLGGVETGAMAQMGVPMRVAQVDLYPVSGQQDVLITGIGHGTGNITGSPSLWLGAGDYGPASGTSFMRMEAPPSEAVSASTNLRMTTDPASGVFETVATLMMPNTQTVDVNGRILKAEQSLRIAAIATNSESVFLRLHREGIGGGSEVEADTSLMMPSVMSTSDINVYMSGSNISTNTVSLAIPSSLSLPSGSLDLFIRGYSE